MNERIIIEIAIETRFVTLGFVRMLSLSHLNDVCLTNPTVSKITAIKIPKIEVVALIRSSKKLVELIEERFSMSGSISGLKNFNPK